MLKSCALFSLCACVSLAADFLTGQAARLVIGQQSFTDQLPGASDTLLGGVGGVAWVNGTLFVADSNRLGLTPLNNRVLEFDTGSFPKPLDSIDPGIGTCPVCVGTAGVVLGQPDFTSTDYHIAQDGMRLPTAVASDGHYLAVADTANNRVLIWNSIPTSNGQPADVVVGQHDFTSIKPVVVDSRSLRAPQGVWIQNGRLFVADTQNHRVLIWNSIPTQNEQPADLVLGQANFNVAVEPDLTKAQNDPHANNLLNPVSVTSDGQRLYVADLGNNRVLIWNSIPTSNQQPADVVIGQKDMDTGVSNDAQELCDSNGTDSDGNPTYPQRCGRTLDFPRFALSDGQRLFVADGGNDRVLIFNTIPAQNAPAPDIILGQSDEFSSAVSSVTDLFHPLLRQSAADLAPTPTSLAFDGTNLYVTDPANRRILVFTPGEPLLPLNGIRNAASMEVFALGAFSVGGTATAGNEITLTVNGIDYKYTVTSDDTLESIMIALAGVINAGTGDPSVLAEYEPTLGLIKVVARVGGDDGNNITLGVSASDGSTVTLAASAATLQGGGNAAIIAPGTLVAMFGHDMADEPVASDTSQETLPLDLGGVQWYCNGIRSPLLYVGPTQINAQVPYEIHDSNNISCYARIAHADGSVVATTALAVPIDQQNPGLFAFPAEEPRPAIAFHATNYATGTISVDGSIEAGDLAIVNIQDRTYTYTVQDTDTLDSVRDALIGLINSNPEERVVAYRVAAFHRFQIRAKVAGPEGDGITFSAQTGDGGNGSVLLVLSNTTGATCCASVAGTLVTTDNPAVPGETIMVFATGLGLVMPDEAQAAIQDGIKYRGTPYNDPVSFVSSLAGGSTANVIAAGLMVGLVGVHEVLLELSPATPASTQTQLTISQDIYTSNIVTIPVLNPNSP
jgi:phage tail sheath gpL-like